MKLEEMPAQSRIWLYACQRPLTAKEQEEIKVLVNDFLPTWAYHGDSLYAAFEILHDSFLVLALNEELARAGGCAIDKSIHLFQEIDRRYSLDLFNRLRVAVHTPDGPIMYSLSEIEIALNNNQIQVDTPVFDSSITRLGELRHAWLRPLSATWVASQVEI